MSGIRRSIVLLSAIFAACGPRPPIEEPAAEPARLASYSAEVYAAFDPERAIETVAYVDRFFRVRGNEGYQRSLARVRSELEGMDQRTLELGPVASTWTPRSATLALGDDAIVRFADETGRDRACLLVRSDPMPETELELVRAGEPDVRGRVVLVESEPRRAFELFVRDGGARGIVVKDLEPYHTDRDAAQFGYLPQHEGSSFGFSVSMNAWDRLVAATEHGPARVRVAIDVAIGASAATAIEARIAGTDPEAGAIVLVAHVDEPGANDNASGVAAQAELARSLSRLIETRAVPRPRRSIVFLFGQEIEVSRRWLDDAPHPVAAGLVMDMVGADPDVVGAPFLIERMPDPGAVWLREPDAHTEWGESDVAEGDLRGHFLNDLISASASAVARIDPFAWRSHPFEGGSDHVPFLERQLPAVLAWHFTDDAYHTTLDRTERVSGAELRRAATVIGASALMMASGDERDALELVAIVERAIRERRASLERASNVLIASGASDRATERRVRDAWSRFEAEALASIAAWHESARVRARIEELR